MFFSYVLANYLSSMSGVLPYKFSLEYLDLVSSPKRAGCIVNPQYGELPWYQLYSVWFEDNVQGVNCKVAQA